VKKYFTTNEYKKKNLRRSRRSLFRKLAFKEYRRLKNISELGLSKPKRIHKHQFEDRYEDYRKIKAPENFTLIGNPEPVIDFISKLKVSFDKKQKVFVVLNEIKKIDYDAIVVLLSIMVRFKSQKIAFNGDFPANEEANKILKESGFFKNLYKQFRDVDRYNITESRDNLIHTHAWKNVDSTLSAHVIEQASETIWNEKRRCQGTQRALIELMLNTNNHATVGKEGDKHWWLSINYRKNENKVTFSFVDYGVGVFKSLENKPEGNKFYKAKDKMLAVFGLTNNAELLRLTLNGELHKTVTGKHYRGKGLPGINDALNRNSFSNLHIITNNVHADVSNGIFKELSCNFSGTFIYWELNQANINCGLNQN
jgi:hypothetical protein